MTNRKIEGYTWVDRDTPGGVTYFTAFYMPGSERLCENGDGRVCRWHHPTLGFICDTCMQEQIILINMKSMEG